jgi:hypothetical protein
MLEDLTSEMRDSANNSRCLAIFIFYLCSVSKFHHHQFFVCANVKNTSYKIMNAFGFECGLIMKIKKYTGLNQT